MYNLNQLRAFKQLLCPSYMMDLKSTSYSPVSRAQNAHAHRVLSLSFFTVDINTNINFFFFSARKQRQERGSAQRCCKRSKGQICWPAGVITLPGSLLVAFLLFGSIYKCRRPSNPTVSPLSLERTPAIIWLGLITYSSNEE